MTVGRPVVLFAVPTPPPFSGPEIVGALLLRAGLDDDFRVCHVGTGVGVSNRMKGRLSLALIGEGLAVWCRFAAALVRHRPAIVYLFLSQNRTGFLRDMALAIAARLSGARLVVHVHGGNFSRFFDTASPTLRRMIRGLLGQCRLVILSGRRFFPQFAGLVPEERLRVVWNPIDWRAYRPATDAATSAPDLCRVLFIGHLSVAKGFGDLLGAIPAVLDAVPGASFDFIGEWLVEERNIRFDQLGRPVVHDARALAASWHELAGRYPDRLRHHTGLSEAEKIALIERGQMFVLPSYSEGFPIAVLEAMAGGLPLVVTPVGALPEVLSDDHAAFVDPGDINAIARAVIELARDPERRARLGQANRALVKDVFSPEAVSRSLSACFRECLA